MHQFGVTVASGSEGKITDEELWVHEHCPWSDSYTEQFLANDGGEDDPAGM